MKRGEPKQYAGIHGEPQMRPHQGILRNHGRFAGLAPPVKTPASNLEFILPRYKQVLGTIIPAFGEELSA